MITLLRGDLWMLCISFFGLGLSLGVLVQGIWNQIKEKEREKQELLRDS